EVDALFAGGTLDSLVNMIQVGGREVLDVLRLELFPVDGQIADRAIVDVESVEVLPANPKAAADAAVERIGVVQNPRLVLVEVRIWLWLPAWARWERKQL